MVVSSFKAELFLKPVGYFWHMICYWTETEETKTGSVLASTCRDHGTLQDMLSWK